MGTRGYIAVKYNKNYYVRYNHMDSYPENLGKKVVEKLKEIKNQYENLDKEQYKEYILSIASDKVTEIEKEEPDTTHMIEWVYLLDLEEMTLKIKGGYYEPAYKIENLLYEDSYSDSDSDSDSDEHSYKEPRWLKKFQKMNRKLHAEVKQK